MVQGNHRLSLVSNFLSDGMKKDGGANIGPDTENTIMAVAG